MLNTIRKFIKFYIFDSFFNFSGTNTPDFDKIPLQLDYDSYWKERGIKKMSNKLRLREKIVFDYITLKSKVMDFGCGYSNLLYFFKKKKNCQVIGFDISQKAIEFQRKFGIEAKLIKNKNYLKQKNFNYIILLEVLEHLANPEKLIAELKNRSDFLIISIPNSAYFAYRFKLLFKGRISMQWMYHPSEHLRFWSHIEFIEWMEALGCELVKFKCTEGIFTSVNFLPNLFSWNIVYVFKNKKRK